MLIDIAGADGLFGGQGDDLLTTYDYRQNDRITGGPGSDRCIADSNDRIRSCP